MQESNVAVHLGSLCEEDTGILKTGLGYRDLPTLALPSPEIALIPEF